MALTACCRVGSIFKLPLDIAAKQSCSQRHFKTCSGPISSLRLGSIAYHQGPAAQFLLRQVQTPAHHVGHHNVDSTGHTTRAAEPAVANGKPAHTKSFQNVKTEEELLAGIQAEIAAKRLPSRAGPGMQLFYNNYKKAMLSSGRPDAEETAVRVMSMVFDRIMVQFEDPFTFNSHHLAIREPYDYYRFGQEYVGPLLNFSESYLGNLHLFDAMEEQLRAGHNVVLLSNHQTEADPAVIALLLEHSHPFLAENLTYVAGDRVVHDPFAKPFSMGRNLLCVYSKKHINDVPELAAEKTKANRRTLVEMARLFKAGGQFIWIAPSGGRDRPDPATGQWVPAAFDDSSVELMRRLSDDSPVPGHLYPLAVLCHDIMPPPPTLDKALGEQRITNYHGVGMSVGPQLHFEEVCQGIEDRKQARAVYSAAAFAAVEEQYKVLEAAVHGSKGTASSTAAVRLEQPWKVEKDAALVS
ncbi:Glycerol-3-Phosphate Acyltransferase [Klebsormidium nitens]|uniref:Glycerol-3-phosphate acyltransferase, chloroplastic n=1 Tax=Klebsormidium nitens TaxID=105231 RepID=A0A1Y1I7H2_KLENI|nr:Glycerol-3-Phosphate Acyltransferase [Klebsormidium nitens]|eukprot:GAQ86900.1 Glycerol-3-Phosphate Acyltransferase [Klebsormidium nitens]